MTEHRNNLFNKLLTGIRLNRFQHYLIDDYYFLKAILMVHVYLNSMNKHRRYLFFLNKIQTIFN